MKSETRTLIYNGDSMRRVFVPGDLIVARPIRFADVRKGDIVVCGIQTKKTVVHRVVARDSIRCITMGDNNPAPDAVAQGASSKLFLAVQRIPLGRRPRPLKNGASGYRQFLWNRLRRRIRLSLISPFFSFLLPMLFWRIALKGKKVSLDYTHWYWRGFLVAYEKPNGRIVFRSPILRLFFRLIRDETKPGSSKR